MKVIEFSPVGKPTVQIGNNRFVHHLDVHLLIADVFGFTGVGVHIEAHGIPLLVHLLEQGVVIGH
jgi:hypothetical protein